MNEMRNPFRMFTVFLAAFSWLFLPVTAQETPAKPEIPEMNLQKPSDRFEIGVHYSFWSLNFIKSILESELGGELGKEFRNEITREIEDLQYTVSQTTYEQQMIFDSGGHNYGLEFRFYPRGRQGPFSLGVSFEQTYMRMTVEGSVRQTFSDGSFADAEAQGEITVAPFFTNLSFRWDLFPEWRVTPYLIFGLGVAELNGEISYDYAGRYNSSRGTETLDHSDIRTFKEAEEEMNTNIPNILPLFQLNLGVRAEIIPHLYVKAGAGIWDGLILRAGISGRF
ncbi:MAG: hypothetical protein R6V02_03540 [Candidatus Aminicenantes bacterium]